MIMDVSGSEDDNSDLKNSCSVSPIPSFRFVIDNAENSEPGTPTDQSIDLKNALGLVVTPDSPPHRKVRSMKLDETSSKNWLIPPFSSTPKGSPKLSNIPRSLKVQRHRSKCDLKKTLSLSTNSIPSSLVNPFSPYRTSEDERQIKKSRIDKKKESKNGEEAGNHDETWPKGIKRPKLSDFDCPKFEKEFIILSLLGSGDHGCVFKCLHLLTGMVYAVKRSLRPVNNEKMARNEIYAHAALEHPFIVRNYVSWTEDDYVFMQNEFCNGGSLEDYINNNGPMEEKELMILMEHVAQGLRFIHKCDLAHLDLKPGNIFLTKGPPIYYRHNQIHDEDDLKEEITYKIGDLGHVIKMNNSGYVEDGDCRYLPREMLNDSHPDYTKVDIFALGLTLYEAAGGGPLPKNGEDWHKIRDGDIRSFSHLSLQFNDLVKRMLDPDPKKRPSACDLLDEICRDEVMKERELKAANQKIHLLEHQLTDIVKTVSKSVNVNSLGTPYKKRTINDNLTPSRVTKIPVADRCTRSASRLVGKETLKSSSFY